MSGFRRAATFFTLRLAQIFIRLIRPTGLASFVGTSGTTDFGALITTGGTVYASTLVAPNSIYTFNPTDGTSTFSTLVAGDYSFGLAPVVPEPSSFALLGLAGSLLGAYAWKRKRNV